ncbi:MAG: 3'-5' exonuclease [Myxococcales bacterium]|nr:3'-5' exonuclease [Myxococcales bacterium]
MGRTYLVLDIETVPDRVIPWDAAVDGFPPAPLHSVVALGVLWLDADYRLRRMGVFGADEDPEGTAPVDEGGILQAFADFLGKEHPHMVTFNGRGFDLPVLANRCLKHGVPFSAYYADRDYRYRFSDKGHIDLSEFLSDYGASRRPRLDSVAQLMGLPGKLDVDGSQVQGMYERGLLREIRDYCLHDVVQTAFLFLRTELLRGIIDRETYRDRARALWDALAPAPRVAVVLDRSDRATVLLE